MHGRDRAGRLQVANGTTDKRTPLCRTLLDAGAVRIKWPEDVDFDEKESAIWSVLKKEDFNKQRHLGWRWSAASIQRLAKGEVPTRAETPAEEQLQQPASPPKPKGKGKKPQTPQTTARQRKR